MIAGVHMISLTGIDSRKGDRHAFVHERVYELIARDTKDQGECRFAKRELAEALGCNVRSVDRAITQMRRKGIIESVLQFDESGAQLGNTYRLIEH